MMFDFNIRGAWKTVFGVGVGAAATVLAPTSAQAALVFQAEQPTYSVTADGSTQASVRLYLVQTDGTNTITAGGGLDNYGLRVSLVNPPANPVRLVSIVSNPAFTGDTDPEGGTEKTDVQAGTAIDGTRGTDSVQGDPQNPNRFFLATFNYSGQGSNGLPALTTTFEVSRRTPLSDDIYTISGPGSVDSLDDQTTPSRFTINVTPIPEPTAVVAIGMVGAGLLARRRRRSA